MANFIISSCNFINNNNNNNNYYYYYYYSCWCGRSRTKVPRPEDTEDGVQFLKHICYPHMNRFIDSKQEMGI